jgi:uncharacterized membrane protein YjgN (DUF898 family)
METFPGTASVGQPQGAYPPEQLRFTGKGGEYFGIWIVNLLLTILTLGIYSPWAKVRRLHYFYRNTQLAGSSFDFHGSPKRILVGRVVALIMFVGYNISVRLHSWVTVFILVALALVMPWLLRNSFRFRLYNTSWRGTRFHFRGTLGAAYRVFLLYGALTLLTLYILMPFSHQRLKAYQHNNTWFGRTQCSFHARAGQFYLVYLLILAAVAVAAVAIGVSGVFGAFAALSAAQRHGVRVDPHTIFRALFVIYGTLILLSVSIGPAFHALVTNLIWNNTRIGEHRIECALSPYKLIWITVSNLVMVIVTLGMFIPWAQVRLAKYQLESMQLLPTTDLQEFVDAEPESAGAVGEEAATVFDFDIAL